MHAGDQEAVRDGEERVGTSPRRADPEQTHYFYVVGPAHGELAQKVPGGETRQDAMGKSGRQAIRTAHCEIRRASHAHGGGSEDGKEVAIPNVVGIGDGIARRLSRNPGRCSASMDRAQAQERRDKAVVLQVRASAWQPAPERGGDDVRISLGGFREAPGAREGPHC